MTTFDPIENPAPLWVWPLACGVALLAIVGSTMLQRDRMIEAHVKRIERARSGGESSELVMVVGDSRTVMGIADPSKLEDAVSRELGGRKVRVLVMATGGMDLSSFDRLWAKMLAARPALVLVELGLLAPEPRDAAADARDRLANAIKKLLRRSAPTKDAYCLEKTPEALAWHREWLSRRMQRPVITAEFANLLDDAGRQGLRVRMFRLPRSPGLQAWIDAELGTFEAEARHLLAAWPWLEVMSAPAFPDALYCDHGHLNAAGSAALLPWFAHAAAQALQMAPPGTTPARR